MLSISRYLITRLLYIVLLFSLTCVQLGHTASSSEVAANEEKSNNMQQDLETNIDKVESILDTLKTLRTELVSGKETDNELRTQIIALDEVVQAIDTKLIEASSELSKSTAVISTSVNEIRELEKELVSFSRGVRANVAELDGQKTLIEDNSVRLYEILIQVRKLEENITTQHNADSGKDDKQAISDAINLDLNQLWLLLSTVLIYLVPLAFILSNTKNTPTLTDGVEQHQGVILMCLCAFLGYFIIGFGVMYGETVGGWAGFPSHLIGELSDSGNPDSNLRFSSFLLHKAGFAMLGVLIIYMAIGRQLSSISHIFLALLLSTLIIPVYGHWVSSGDYTQNNLGWLQSLGFIDSTGMTTINIIAGWFSLVFAWKVKTPRADRKKTQDKVHEPIYSSSAVLLLWIGWWGFTAGTLSLNDQQIPSIILKLGLAASASGLTAFLYYALFNKDNNSIASGLCGFVGGLVAITASAQLVTFVEAAVIGVIAGLLQNIAYQVLRKKLLRYDWQVPAAYLVSIHGVVGIWGAICLAIFGTEGSFMPPSTTQLGIQVQGAGIAVLYSVCAAHLVLLIIRPPKQAKQEKTKLTKASTAS
ncbi:hypothetical protein [Leucothrix arctica]|uniref:Ammonium transporter AmtB-like domain-containing protein n=1 Tax=Leucothrix arctica TaxID=1481894 RepID=A0A317CF83_9GAMM|nr:hypothetical protein [Leucothrix arctica]PWQ97166.1 hypothetical protein DKT75_07575 [Leucothrix arctica]